MRPDRIALSLAVLGGCGRISFGTMAGDARIADSALNDVTSPDVAPLVCGPWSTTATHIVSLVSVANDWGPAIHPDGIHLAFSSNRISTAGSEELYIATNNGTSFDPPSVISTLSQGTSFDLTPTWSPAGDQLFFSTSRATGGLRLFVSDYAQGVFSAPIQIDELSAEWVDGPTLSPDALELYYDDSGLGTSGVAHIRRATRTSLTSPWVLEGIESQLDVGGESGWPTISPDSLTMYFEGNVAGGTHLYESRRASTADHFGTPVMLVDFDPDASSPGDPEFSRDGRTLYFTAAYVPNQQGSDLFSVTRTCN